MDRTTLQPGRRASKAGLESLRNPSPDRDRNPDRDRDKDKEKDKVHLDVPDPSDPGLTLRPRVAASTSNTPSGQDRSSWI